MPDFSPQRLSPGRRGRSAFKRCPKLGKQRAEPPGWEERPRRTEPVAPLGTGSHALGVAVRPRSHGLARGQQVPLPGDRPGRGPKG